MIRGSVHEFAFALWARREAGKLPDDSVIGRGLALAAANDVMDNPGYDPEWDKRVEWVREIARLRRHKTYRPHNRLRASAELEALMGWMWASAAAEILSQNVQGDGYNCPPMCSRCHQLHHHDQPCLPKIGERATDATNCSVVLLTSEPQHAGGFFPVLHVDHQSFSFGMQVETQAEADWYCSQMRTALDRAGCRVRPQNDQILP